MSEKVAKLELRDVNTEPVDDVVECLEDCLRAAKSGELRSVAIVGDMTGNLVFRTCAMNDRVRLLGHLYRAMRSVDDA